ncbi:SseB family protein [Breznakia pachnodae]|uniref:Uncharacterized protein n=1 Tax=Breznakia pachnodae TaxID=265178 RepID=A0ABU0E1U4_9FIRM|nr:SseB family protein [Breznakia pachnodae]MDQ0360850.1 hypothetical protein [Breznakia pachnodae]
MIFNSIDNEYYENKINEDEKTKKKLQKFIMKGLLVTTGCILFAIIGISNSEPGTLITIISGIAVFPGISAFFITFFTTIQYLIFINEIKKEKNNLNNPPILEIKEDGSFVYQLSSEDHKQHLDQIKGYRKIKKRTIGVYMEHSLIAVDGIYRNQPRTIEIKSGFEEKEKIMEILNIYTEIANAEKPFINTLKEALSVYSENIELMLNDINDMDFIMPVKYKLTGFVHTGYYLPLEYGALEVELFTNENNKNYVCIYTTKEEMQNSEKQCMRTTYSDILKKIIDNTSDIFKSNQIDGILINNYTDHIKIDIVR